MNDTLRNIGESYLEIRDQLLNCVDPETGEIIGEENVELFRELENIQDSFEKKARNVALVCLELGDRREAIQREIDRLKTLLKRAERAEEWLRGYLSESMILTGYERIDGITTNISFRNSEETVIDNIEFLPPEYLKVKTTYSPDKTAIKQAIKAGKEVNGAHLEKKKNLQIK